MDFAKHNRSVGLRCSTCGGGDFRRDASVEDGPIECGSCGRVFTKDELIRENGEIIHRAADEMKADVFADIRGQLRNAFRNSKFK